MLAPLVDEAQLAVVERHVAVAVMREETFGPVAAVAVVEDWSAALRRAASGEYGLAATVLTPDTAHALEAAEELEVGTVKVNTVFGGAPGGSADPRRASGSGRGYGPDLLGEPAPRDRPRL
jgi:succinate-semialdehyde dehydrogenase/glutarate-semialdehyde dehydrogenase